MDVQYRYGLAQLDLIIYENKVKKDQAKALSTLAKEKSLEKSKIMLDKLN